MAFALVFYLPPPGLRPGAQVDNLAARRMISAMVQKVVVSLIDDLDGQSEAEGTVEYALDGVTYEIDLTEDNAAAFA